jgi:hypothetical protein
MTKYQIRSREEFSSLFNVYELVYNTNLRELKSDISHVRSLLEQCSRKLKKNKTKK